MGDAADDIYDQMLEQSLTYDLHMSGRCGEHFESCVYCNIEYEEEGMKEGNSAFIKEKFSKQFYVAGVKFRTDWKKNINGLMDGQGLDLLPEPTNKYDKDAVRVNSGAINLGYVPAKTGDARIIAGLLRDGIKLQATLVELQPDFEHWNSLLVEVKEVE